MALLAEQLVGRAEELGALDHALAELDRGSTAALQLVGEPASSAAASSRARRD
jgi:hypothetical protein